LIVPFLNDLIADLRFTFRLFRKSIGFSLVAVSSLALGIGASSAIFSLVYAVLIDPYPYKNSDRIITSAFTDRQGHTGEIHYTIPDFLEIKKTGTTLEDVFLGSFRPSVATHGLPVSVNALAYSPNAFDFMGVPAILGRTFGPKDIPVPAAPPNIGVISYVFWQRYFNRDLRVVGKTIELNHQVYTILGVLPPRYTWGDMDIYVPLPMLPDSSQPLHIIARIKPGISLQAASAELQAMTERFAKRSPNVYPKNFRIHVERLNDWLLGKFRGTLIILMTAVGFLLLIACGNVSILLLARAGARQKEIAVRLSLGAGRARILQQLLTESVILSLTGGLIGVLIAYRGVPAIVALMPQYSVPHEAAIQVNAMVVLFTFLISVLTGILFGMAPALQLAKRDTAHAMQESGRASTGSTRTGNMRSLLIVSQVALSLVLLVGAGIAIRGFISVSNVRLGYDPSNVLMIELNISEGAYKTWETRSVFLLRVLDKLQATPGVTSAAASVDAMAPWIGFETAFELSGRPANPTQQTLVGLVGGDYFKTLHIPLLRGRAFSNVELEHTAEVAVINEEMLRQYWPDGRNPIGLKIRVPQLKFEGNPSVVIPPNRTQTLEIVGVVATARNQGLEKTPKPAIYVPYTLLLPPECAYLIRTNGDPHKLIHALTEQVRAVDPGQPVSEVMTLEESNSRFNLSYPRFSTILFSIFASVGLLLAAAGIYSVVSYVVTRRTHEFGIRMTLGARTGDVVGLVAGTIARLILSGIAIGLACSLALSRVIANYVRGWDPKDPVAFLAVTLVFLIVGLTACFFPARKAIAIQPIIALRHE
jgi:predicted permease